MFRLFLLSFGETNDLFYVHCTGINSDEVGNVRSIQCHAFHCIFDFVSVRLETSQGYFFPLRRSFSAKGEYICELDCVD